MMYVFLLPGGRHTETNFNREGGFGVFQGGVACRPKTCTKTENLTDLSLTNRLKFDKLLVTLNLDQVFIERSCA